MPIGPSETPAEPARRPALVIKESSASSFFLGFEALPSPAPRVIPIGPKLKPTFSNNAFALLIKLSPSPPVLSLWEALVVTETRVVCWFRHNRVVVGRPVVCGNAVTT